MLHTSQCSKLNLLRPVGAHVNTHYNQVWGTLAVLLVGARCTDGQTGRRTSSARTDAGRISQIRAEGSDLYGSGVWRLV